MRSDLRRNAWEVCGHPTVARLFEPSRLHWSLQVLGPRVQNAEGCLRRLQRKRVQDPVVQELVERSAPVRKLREFRLDHGWRRQDDGHWNSGAPKNPMSSLRGHHSGTDRRIRWTGLLAILVVFALATACGRTTKVVGNATKSFSSPSSSESGILSASPAASALPVVTHQPRVISS